jgi:hypothetical protein
MEIHFFCFLFIRSFREMDAIILFLQYVPNLTTLPAIVSQPAAHDAIFVFDPSNGRKALFASAILHTSRRRHPSVSTTCHANSIPNLNRTLEYAKAKGGGELGHFTDPVDYAFTNLLLLFFLPQMK